MTRSWLARCCLTLGLCWLVIARAPSAHAQDDSQFAEPDETQPAHDADDTETALGDLDEDAQAPIAREAPASPEPAVRTEVAAGMGVGTRSFSRPTRAGEQQLPDAVFPAVDAALRVHVWPRAAFSIGVLLRYQSSLGLTVEDEPSFALPNRVDVRAERVELSAAPTLRLGESGADPALAFPVGLTLRSFWPEVHETQTPGYSLFGPHLRAELIVRFGGVLTLRFGPELQAIIAIDRSLRDEGVDRAGFAYGGEALLQVPLGPVFGLELAYRESHAVVPTYWIDRDEFRDVERFASLRLSGGF